MNNLFYAYTHAKPDGRVFYVGKGTGHRGTAMYGRSKEHRAITLECGARNIVVNMIPCDSEDEAFKLEISLIRLFKQNGAELINKTSGGEGLSGWVCSDESRLKHKALWTPERRAYQAVCISGRKHSAESIQKMRESGLARPPMSDDLKMRISRTLTGKKHSDETKAKLSAAGRGRKHSEESKKKIGYGNTGKLVSEQTREKLRINQTGKKYGVETKEKVSASLLGNRRAAGSHWFHNGTTSIKAKVCPDGFVAGRITAKTNSKALAGNKFTLGTHWYTNGIINTMKKECPPGFHLGMTSKEKTNG